MDIFLVIAVTLILGYCALSLVTAGILKILNPDGAFDDFSYWELCIKWPLIFKN